VIITKTASPGRCCDVCGGVLGRNNVIGVCRRTPECNRTRNQRMDRARGIRPPEVRLRERLFANLVIDLSGCVLWTGHCERGGYGQIWAYGRTRPVHVVMWMLCEGPIPPGMELDYLCHNRHATCMGGPTCPHRRCANLSHLEIVTKLTNTQRAFARPAIRIARDYGPHSSRYTGVTWHKKAGKWQAAIYVTGKSRYLGLFESEKDAASAYNIASLDAFGPHPFLNEVAP
jgi:AP2 domain